MKEENKLLPDVEATTDENLDSVRELFEYFSESAPDLLEGNPLESIVSMQSGGKTFKKPVDPYAGLTSNDLIDVIQSKQNQEVARRYNLKSNTDVKNYADGTATPATRNRIQTDAAKEFTDKGNNKARTEINTLRNREVVTRRNERKAEVKTKGNVGGTTALGPKLRLYPNEANNFVDDYLNVPAMIGDAADNFNDKFMNRNTPESSVGEKAMAAAGLGLTLAGGIAAKSPLSKVNQILNPLADIPVIPSRRRILPDAFDITTLETPGGRSGLKGYNSFVHAKGKMSESYGDLITKEFPVSHNADLTANLDLKPYSINVDKVIQGNRVQDALYQSNLDFIKKNSNYKYIRSGDDLLSAPATQKFHSRSVMEDIPKTGDVHQNERTGELFFMPVRKYFGSQNPNVINEVIERLNKLPKHETTFKSIREVVEPQVDKLKQRFTPNRPMYEKPKSADIDDNPFGLSRTDKPGISISSIKNASKHINPMFKEAVGRMRHGDKPLEAGQKWFDNWIEHPRTRDKLLEGDYVADKTVGEFIDTYRPKIQRYPFKSQVKDMYDTLLNRNPSSKPEFDHLNAFIHKRNLGVSYNHDHSMQGTLNRMKSGEKLGRRDGSWVSANNTSRGQESTAVHELTHDYFKRPLMQDVDGFAAIHDNVDEALINLVPKTPTEKRLAYLADPAEVHARIMQLRNLYDVKPNDKISGKLASDMAHDMNKSNAHGRNLKYVVKDSERLKNLLNRLATVGVAGAASSTVDKEQ